MLVKLVNRLVENTLSNKNSIYVFALPLLVLQIYALSNGSYTLSHVDEAIFSSGSQSFAQTGKAITNYCIQENVSVIGQYNWYGPFWNILYGIGFMVLSSNLVFILINILFAWLSIYLISNYLSNYGNLVAVLILLCYPWLYYQFSFFPETVFFFVSVVNLVFLFRLIRSANKNTSLLLFALLIFIEIPIRVTSVFWLFGLIPFLNRKNFVWLSGLIFSGVFTGFLYLKYLCAPAFVSGLKSFTSTNTNNFMHLIAAMFEGLYKNIIIIIVEHHPGVLLLLFMISLCTYVCLKHRSKLLIAITLISWISVGTMLMLYSTISFFFVKLSMFLYPLLIFGIVSANEEYTYKKWLLVLFTLLSPIVFYKTFGNIQKHKQISNNESLVFYNSLPKIADLETKESILTILFNAPDFEKYLQSSQYLPFVNKNGKNIRYTSNITPANAKLEIKYKLHGKLPVSYVILKNAEVDKLELKKPVLKLYGFQLFDIKDTPFKISVEN